MTDSQLKIEVEHLFESGINEIRVTDLASAASEDKAVLFNDWVRENANWEVLLSKWVYDDSLHTTSELYQIFNTKKEG